MSEVGIYCLRLFILAIMKSWWVSITVMTCFLLLSSCKMDTGVSEQVVLDGVYEIADARRDGRPTKSLETAVIDFVSSDSLVSNLFTADKVVTYTYDGSTIHIAADQPMDLRMRYASSDSIVVWSRINKHRYDMTFVQR